LGQIWDGTTEVGRIPTIPTMEGHRGGLKLPSCQPCGRLQCSGNLGFKTGYTRLLDIYS
jgi:hypothetical protein